MSAMVAVQTSLGSTCLCCHSSQSVISSGRRLAFSSAWRRRLQQHSGKPYCVSCAVTLTRSHPVWLQNTRLSDFASQRCCRLAQDATTAAAVQSCCSSAPSWRF
jgi:hypothetical protein